MLSVIIHCKFQELYAYKILTLVWSGLWRILPMHVLQTEAERSSVWTTLISHWRRWRQASTSPVNFRVVTLTSFPFLCRITWLVPLGWSQYHDDVIKWKHLPRYWPFVRGIHRSPVNSPHEGQWRGPSMFSSISVWINGWVNNREAGD